MEQLSQEYLDMLEAQRAKLLHARENNRSVAWCLRLWSRYTKARDNFRCVLCDSQENIQAHHIWRRTTYPDGQYELGNGITLCKDCHKKVHAEFNGKPNPSEPINARGGDDQDEIAFVYGMAWEDAVKRGLNEDRYYYICDQMLEFFVKVQGHEYMLESVREGRMSRIRFAHEVWRNAPEGFYEVVAEAVGVAILSAKLNR